METLPYHCFMLVYKAVIVRFKAQFLRGVSVASNVIQAAAISLVLLDSTTLQSPTCSTLLIVWALRWLKRFQQIFLDLNYNFKLHLKCHVEIGPKWTWSLQCGSSKFLRAFSGSAKKYPHWNTPAKKIYPEKIYATFHHLVLRCYRCFDDYQRNKLLVLPVFRLHASIVISNVKINSLREKPQFLPS